MDDVTQTRTDLDCTNVSVTDGTKINCLTIDLTVPYFIWMVVSAGLSFLLSKSF